MQDLNAINSFVVSELDGILTANGIAVTASTAELLLSYGGEPTRFYHAVGKSKRPVVNVSNLDLQALKTSLETKKRSSASIQWSKVEIYTFYHQEQAILTISKSEENAIAENITTGDQWELVATTRTTKDGKTRPAWLILGTEIKPRAIHIVGGQLTRLILGLDPEEEETTEE